MSAFFTGRDHINAMLTHAQRLHMRLAEPGKGFGDDWAAWQDHRFNDEDLLTRIGRDLMQTNADSLAHLYGHEWRDMLGDNDPATFVFKQDLHFETRFPIQAGFTLVRCYEYQSCEHPGWKTSWAREFCRHMTEATASKLTVEGCWEYHRPADAPRIISLSSLARTARR